MSILGSHPHVVAHSELFHCQDTYSLYHAPESKSLYKRLLPLLSRNLRPVHFLELLLVRTYVDNPKAQYVLFKLFWYHNRRVMRHVIKNSYYRIIVQSRKKKLEQ